MKKKVIGLLGYRGLVGHEALQVLRRDNKYQLRLGSRSAETSAYSAEDGVSCHKVDIYDRQQLTQFCEPCDLIINCAGPASKIKDAVAEVCIDLNKFYVDPAGDKTMVAAVKDCLAKHQSTPACVLSAGVYPGLTEVFLNYLAEECFDQMETVKEYLAGTGCFSVNGAYDVISSLANDEGVGLAYLNKGKIERLAFGFDGSVLLPKPVGQVQSMPLVTEEFSVTVHKLGLKDAYFYNTFTDDNMLNQFIMLKASGQYKTEEQKLASAKKLIEIYDTGGQQGGSLMIYALSTGQKNGQKIELCSTFYCNTDWNALSGTVAGIVADSLLDNESLAGGCYFAEQVVSAKHVVDHLIDVKNASLEHRTDLSQGKGVV